MHAWGETVWLLRLLPGLLHGRGGGVLAFLDLAKAYATVDCPFLLAIMGADAGLRAWTTLLSGTWAMAVVNGFPSDPTLFTAGVRQGCTLSPLLFLCVAEALRAWLTYRGINVPGIGVPGPGMGAWRR